ncbi:sarcosine oxidase subunit delta [Methylocella sp.]|jgi:sarcosine oxidase subunit delta|uniref:sarcosine oxidase subunit delta n=1 Tax=Methylocella sp. TaxID=1978226 RepID=UPI003C1F45F4
MLINCPYCGPRDLAEFVVNGEAIARPDVDGDLDGPDICAAFAEAVYLRDNPAGLHREHWFHSAGCQSWLLIERDTRTHEIVKVEATRAPGQAS